MSFVSSLKAIVLKKLHPDLGPPSQTTGSFPTLCCFPQGDFHIQVPPASAKMFYRVCQFKIWIRIHIWMSPCSCLVVFLRWEKGGLASLTCQGSGLHLIVMTMERTIKTLENPALMSLHVTLTSLCVIQLINNFAMGTSTTEKSAVKKHRTTGPKWSPLC